MLHILTSGCMHDIATISIIYIWSMRAGAMASGGGSQRPRVLQRRTIWHFPSEIPMSKHHIWFRSIQLYIASCTA